MVTPRWLCYHWTSKVLPPTRLLLTPKCKLLPWPSQPSGGWSALFQPAECWSLDSPLRWLRLYENTVFFSCGVGCSRIAVVQKFSVLLCRPFPGPVGREIRVLLRPFCVCALWYFRVVGILGSMSGIYEAKENPGNSRGPEVPRRKVSPPFLLGLFYIMFGVFSCTQWEEQTKRVYSIFPVAGGLR